MGCPDVGPKLSRGATAQDLNNVLAIGIPDWFPNVPILSNVYCMLIKENNFIQIANILQAFWGNKIFLIKLLIPPQNLGAGTHSLLKMNKWIQLMNGWIQSLKEYLLNISTVVFNTHEAIGWTINPRVAVPISAEE